jgi:hypothetical protein
MKLAMRRGRIPARVATVRLVRARLGRAGPAAAGAAE